MLTFLVLQLRRRVNLLFAALLWAVPAQAEGGLTLAGVYVPPLYATQVEEKREQVLAGATLREVGISRHGNAVAYLTTAGGEVLQQWLVQKGWAYVMPKTAEDDPVFLLPYEEQARRAKQGVWEDDMVHDASAPGHIPSDTFAVIRGRIANVTQTKQMVYLNFGNDWKTDTTAAIAKEDMKRFPVSDMLNWAGRQVEIRGIAYGYNGPRIDLTHPAQIRLVE